MLRYVRLPSMIFVVAVIACAMFAGTSSAGKDKGSNTVTCSLSAGTTFTWVAGTSEVTYIFRRSDNTTTVQGFFFPAKPHQAGSNTIATPSDAATVQATFFEKGIGAETPANPCTT